MRHALPVAFSAALLSATTPCLAEQVLGNQASAEHAVGSAPYVARTLMGEAASDPASLVWVLVASILVFWMQAGFALVEAGFTRAKNVVNILMKNLIDYVVGSLVFWGIGFGLMFGASEGWFGTTGFFLSDVPEDKAVYTFLLFQTVFCGTAATIASGAMAERTKFGAYVVMSAVTTAVVYPVFGGWVWNPNGWLAAGEGSWLRELGLPPFRDFAGSTVVHSVGGWTALAGAMLLGPRIGKYDASGRPRPILGHSMPLAVLGAFILWMGWFGFNAGSTLGALNTSPNFALIAVNTNLAACGGAATAMLLSWKATGKSDLGIGLNGVLAGLVSITAGCAWVQPLSAILIGSVGGALLVFSLSWFEKLQIDDPVGAISVHGVSGVWGTLAVAFFQREGFSLPQLKTQAIGVVACFAWAFLTAQLCLRALRAVTGLRVSADSETEGLDVTEHAAEGYPPDLFASDHDPEPLTTRPTSPGRV